MDGSRKPRKDEKMDEKQKKKKIAEEFSRITQFFEKIPKTQKEVVLPLLQNAAFMKVTLEELQDQINHDGAIEEYKNGVNQYGVKQSASLQSYNALIKNYASVIKNLCGMLPKEDDNDQPSKLELFRMQFED